MSPPSPPRILVIGYGNPGRRDDGLGPAFAARLEALHLPGVTVESDYQLSIEHAHSVAQHDVVVFADAATDIDDQSPFYLRPVQPAPGAQYTSHSVSPQAVLQLAAQCFDAHPRGWLLGIRAGDLESFAEGLTAAAEANLSAALEAFTQTLESDRLLA
jgi:hydrogenase maturation protease